MCSSPFCQLVKTQSWLCGHGYQMKAAIHHILFFHVKISNLQEQQYLCNHSYWSLCFLIGFWLLRWLYRTWVFIKRNKLTLFHVQPQIKFKHWKYHPEVICELCMNYDACLLFLHNKLICINWDKFIIMQRCDSGIGLFCLKSKYWWDLSSCLSLGVLFKSSFCLWTADLQSQEATGCPLCVTFFMLWEFVSLWLRGPYLFSFAFLRFFPFLSIGLVQTSLIRQAYLEIYPFDELKNALSETLIISLKFCLQSQ